MGHHFCVKALLIFSLLAPAASFAVGGPGLQLQADGVLQEIYENPSELNHATLQEKIAHYAEMFLRQSVPYVVDPLGEGEHADYSKRPLYRFDGFDCTTFVETVISLSRASSAEQFRTEINRVRYKDAVVSFESRNHFPSVDWIPNNIKAGIVRDITGVVGGSSTKWAQTLIEKDQWYRHKGARFQNAAEKSGKAWGRIDYISKEDLLRYPGLLERIPSGSVFNVVRPNWDLRSAIGTRLDVSHQGFLIRENGALYMIHASNGVARDGSDDSRRVKKDLLVDYIRRVMMNSPSTAGFNILQVLER